MPRTLKLTLAYDGTTFVGWQRQSRGASIQGIVEDALSRIEGASVTVIGAGRTDAGAHALGQVASVRLSNALDRPALQRALNAMLPPDVRVLDVEEADPDFHARYAARSKTYRYFIAHGDLVSPFAHRYVWRVRQRLDIQAMQAAARAIEGHHDFAAFQAAGGFVPTTVRTVRSSVFSEWRSGDLWGQHPIGIPVVAVEGHETRGRSRLLAYEVAADGFLRHMVRIIAGTLVDIGGGRRDVDSVARALASRDRADAGPTAPARGLFLVSVAYA